MSFWDFEVVTAGAETIISMSASDMDCAIGSSGDLDRPISAARAFVANLPVNVTPAELFQLFTPFGIEAIEYVHRKGSRVRRTTFAFVRFPNAGCLTQVLNSRLVLRGHKLVIEEKLHRDDPQPCGLKPLIQKTESDSPKLLARSHSALATSGVSNPAGGMSPSTPVGTVLRAPPPTPATRQAEGRQVSPRTFNPEAPPFKAVRISAPFTMQLAGGADGDTLPPLSPPAASIDSYVDAGSECASPRTRLNALAKHLENKEDDLDSGIGSAQLELPALDVSLGPLGSGFRICEVEAIPPLWTAQTLSQKISLTLGESVIMALVFYGADGASTQRGLIQFENAWVAKMMATSGGLALSGSIVLVIRESEVESIKSIAEANPETISFYQGLGSETTKRVRVRSATASSTNSGSTYLDGPTDGSATSSRVGSPIFVAESLEPIVPSAHEVFGSLPLESHAYSPEARNDLFSPALPHEAVSPDTIPSPMSPSLLEKDRHAEEEVPSRELQESTLLNEPLTSLAPEPASPFFRSAKRQAGNSVAWPGAQTAQAPLEIISMPQPLHYQDHLNSHSGLPEGFPARPLGPMPPMYAHAPPPPWSMLQPMAAAVPYGYPPAAPLQCWPPTPGSFSMFSPSCTVTVRRLAPSDVASLRDAVRSRLPMRLTSFDIAWTDGEVKAFIGFSDPGSAQLAACNLSAGPIGARFLDVGLA